MSPPLKSHNTHGVPQPEKGHRREACSALPDPGFPRCICPRSVSLTLPDAFLRSSFPLHAFEKHALVPNLKSLFLLLITHAVIKSWQILSAHVSGFHLPLYAKASALRRHLTSSVWTKVEWAAPPVPPSHPAAPPHPPVRLSA